MGEDQPGEPRTTIEMTFERIFCPIHGEPFRAQWPKGYALFGVKGLQTVMGYAPVQSEGQGKVENIQKLLERKPVCCRLKKVDLLELYKECNIATEDVCVFCRKKQLGTPFSLATPRGEKHHRHVCFQCVVWSIKPL